MTIYTIGSVLTILLQCTNIRMMWDQTAVGSCWTVKQIKMLGYLNICLNISTDIAFSVGIPASLTKKNSFFTNPTDMHS